MNKWELDTRLWLASKALDEQAWLRARQGKITATLIAKASTRAGFDEALSNLITPPGAIEDNAYMEFGRRMEPYIALYLKEEFGILPNEWLIRHKKHEDYVATPDGIHLTQPYIAEIKTTGKEWESWSKVPIAYRRQVQWQMYVTGAQSCVFAWLLRTEKDGRMMPAWFEPKTVIVDRDEKYIKDLEATASELKRRKDEHNATIQPG